MPIYSVCSLLIHADSLSQQFTPFLICNNNSSGKIDLTIEYIPQLYTAENLQKTVELSYMSVWKEKLPGSHCNWVYILQKNIGMIIVDEDYTQIKVYYNTFGGCLQGTDIAELFSPYIQILLECKLIKSGYAILHSACIQTSGYAYAFTGPSGIGKSSRAAKWCEHFSAEWISGDRPAIDPDRGYVYGVPWDGKEAVFRNVCYPLAAILRVKRSNITAVNELTEKEKIGLLCEQTVFPMWDPTLALQAMKLIKQMIRKIPIYEISCDLTDESTYRSKELIINAIKKEGLFHED